MNKWQIKDLQGVGDVELSLDDSKRVFVLFGTNGVGKTKTLEALYFYNCFKVNKQSLDEIMFDISEIFFDNIQYLNNDVVVEKLSFSQSKMGVQFVKEESKSKPFEYKTISENFLPAINENLLSISFITTQNRFELSNSYSNYFRKFPIHSGEKNHDVRQWIINKAQEVNPYHKKSLQRKNEIEYFLEALYLLDSRFENDLGIDDGKVFLIISGQEKELSELSSGFTAVIKIIQSIISAFAEDNKNGNLLKTSGIVLIDEIENHLHLKWQVKIIPTLKKLFPNTTFYIATHSPLVLSQLEEGEAYLLERDNDGVVRSKMVNSPNKRILANVLCDTFGIDLNQLKRQSMEHSDQSKAKAKLLALLKDKKNKEGYFSE